MSGTLYLVGTPIGNLEDLTDRARRVLAEADLIAAEDTRRTGRLLETIGVRARIVSFFEGNEEQRVPRLIDSLNQGSNVALVTDAGMPGISDPGFRLVAGCVEAGIPIDVVPGPSAAIAALVISGLPTDRFVFEGFIPRSGRSRRERLAALATEPRTVVLFESPLRLRATLAELLAAAGDRRAVIARELTKLHQEVIRGRLSELLEEIRDRALKGEVVLVLEGAGPDARLDRRTEGDAVQLAAELVRGGVRKRDAAKRAAQGTGIPAARIYQALTSKDYGTDAGSNSASRGRRADSSE